MEIIRQLPEKLRYKNPVITIGNFDGVHLGHQKIFRKVVDAAQEIGGIPMAMTFDPHPVRILAPERGLKIITTLEDKANLISHTGIRVLIRVPFDKEFARTSPYDFISDVLVRRLGVKWVIVGHNYAFGRGKKGTTALLRRLGRKYGFKVSIVRYATVYGDIVSSSRIRSLLLRGRVCEASQMLGRAYHIEGTVMRGAGRGTPLLQTPTANISVSNELVPKEGVYAVKVSVAVGQGTETVAQALRPKLSPVPPVFEGIANIGKNPTFGDAKMSYEVHLFDYHDDLLGTRLRVHFLERIRDERKFPVVGDLREQIGRDIEKARRIIGRKTTPLYL